MKLGITTPALIFSTISLLMLAYTSRFIGLASLIRSLNKEKNTHERKFLIQKQIENLQKRVRLIKNMQFFAIASLFSCVFSMFLLFLDKYFLGEFCFAFALFLLMISLILSMIEIHISVKALELELKECSGDECQI